MAEILSGWKEIAAYMGHGLRTVQRWEVIGLPVHRPKGTNRSAVIAFKEELDVWSHATPIRYAQEIEELKAKVASLEKEIQTLKRIIERSIVERNLRIR
jgi:hypothetical protein